VSKAKELTAEYSQQGIVMAARYMTLAANGMHYTGSKAFAKAARGPTPVVMTLAEGIVLNDRLVGGDVNVHRNPLCRIIGYSDFFSA